MNGSCHHVSGPHALHFRRAVAQLLEQFGSVLPQPRWTQAYAEALTLERDRKQRRLGGFTGSPTIGQAHVREPAGGPQVLAVAGRASGCPSLVNWRMRPRNGMRKRRGNGSESQSSWPPAGRLGEEDHAAGSIPWRRLASAVSGEAM